LAHEAVEIDLGYRNLWS